MIYNVHSVMGTYNTGRIAKQQWIFNFLNIKININIYY